MEPQIDYQALFRQLPGVMAVLAADFTVLDVSEDAEEAAGRAAEDLVGKNLFQLFRPNPQEPDASGPRDLAESLHRALATGEPDVMSLTRYDLEDPGRPGVFEERHWAIASIPVLQDGQVTVIVFRAIEVTHLIHEALQIAC